MTTCYIGIGSNVGDRSEYINKAIDLVRGIADTRVARVSSIYETEPVSLIPQGDFLNGVLEVETILRPQALLRELNKIEASLGRRRLQKNGPRTIDLDILYYGDEVIEEEGLIIPHPRIGEREFVLKGLRELGKNIHDEDR